MQTTKMRYTRKNDALRAAFSIFNIFRWARSALLLGPKGPTVAAEGCSSPQELEKAGRTAAIFLVLLNIYVYVYDCHVTFPCY